eukprot:CAMPEP_0206329254 /NCGR_PEP_ID=MMETSP0106_2-20121207/23103_1 /ASSEMBLY_ACC=CAM_ASM_000206 /TAXON_ID=81532 /ORGANISM="Acanthoeca-like sp., Strain 10tr" /LENGTH=58 /DNA_ID=CAMNT_0053761965 /DNA_START=245 /DNA_END=418 /DNA_ORIENTATION=+
MTIFHLASVNHVPNSRNRQRCLCNVGRNNAESMAFGRRFKHPGLFFRRKCREKRQDMH